MLLQEQDWSELYRAYRRCHGLKQDAMARDFNDGQSTVSRWRHSGCFDVFHTVGGWQQAGSIDA